MFFSLLSDYLKQRLTMYELLDKVNFVFAIARKVFATVFFSIILGFSYHSDVFSQLNQSAPELDDVGVIEQLGTQLNLDLQFVDQNGKSLALRDFFSDDKPVILSLVYYNCPQLCHLVTEGLSNAIYKFENLDEGQKLAPTAKENIGYTILSVSIDPTDTPSNASKFNAKYAQALSNWSFLTGSSDAISELASEVGFRYSYNDKTKDYAHTAVIMILTPEGKVARYLYGITFDTFDIKLGLIEAKKNKYQNTIERVLLFCYNYDPDSRGYVLQAQRLMRIGGGLTLILLIGFIIKLIRNKNEGLEHE